jgi:Mg/Co/Ni transporter MgtE
MPYISKNRRAKLDADIEKLAKQLTAMGIGDTVYAIYKLLKLVYGDTLNFYTKAQALAVLESAKLEYYRRIIAPYEDEKIMESGDV